ncbi:MAG: flagellar hook-basal body complex protein [Angelakisella sp.]
MVRSMYSGVVGMRAQQSAMDVIGNNIANVKTYGFKASRATFKDVYYQTMKSGSGSTANRGGTNSAQIGYGAQLGSIDVLHGQSSFSMTGRPLDMAIAGEGFFQVMDADGNTFYTRAGQFNFDPSGNLVDSNGNFILGVSGDPLGRTGGSEKIQLNIPSVPPKPSSVTESINNVNIKIESSNNSDAGNVSFNFAADSTLPAGLPVDVDLAGGSGIIVKLNASETFKDMKALEDAVNAAIIEANGGKEHPGGRFKMSIEPAAKFEKPLTRQQICSKDYSVITGKFTGADWPADLFGGMQVKSTSSDFAGKGTVLFDPAKFTPAGVAPNATLAKWTISMKIGNETYTGEIDSNRTAAGEVVLKNAKGGTVTMTHPGFDKLNDLDAGKTGTIAPPAVLTTGAATPITASPAEASKNLGLESKVIKLGGGTEGGAQGIENLESIVVSADGVVTAKHAVHGEISVGRIDLVTFANPQGLVQAGNTYFGAGPNAGKASLTQPGRNGAGELATGSLEQSSVDLSQEFSDMITTQRAYQANSRLITVSDTMLEELVNLKR